MRIYIAEINGSGRFEARRDLPDGAVLVMASRQPLLDAARKLQREGVSGRIDMWDAVRPYPRMTGDIDVLAGLTIGEENKGGLEVRRWKPLPGAVGASKTADQG